MTNNKLNPKSKLQKYKKEIGWLLREKYFIEDLVAQEYFIQKVILSKAKEPVPNRPINQYTNFQSIKEDIKRILNGEPIDFVIGFKEFLNCKIDLSLKPLIPRLETEFWVSNIITNYKLQIANSQILDLCCGSGCIGISLLKNILNCNVTFVDISDKALEQTKFNCELNLSLCHPEQSEGSHLKSTINKIQTSNNAQSTNYKIIKSNLFNNLKEHKFDFIFTNPPYVKNTDIKGSLKYEPSIALDGIGNNGLDIMYKILEEFPKYLNKKGVLFLEFGYGQKAKIEKKIKEEGLKRREKWNFKFIKDQFGKYRIIKLEI